MIAVTADAAVGLDDSLRRGVAVAFPSDDLSRVACDADIGGHRRPGVAFPTGLPFGLSADFLGQGAGVGGRSVAASVLRHSDDLHTADVGRTAWMPPAA